MEVTEVDNQHLDAFAEIDGVAEGGDNGPSDANSGQTDTDGDGVGDACDACAAGDDSADVDGDGMADIVGFSNSNGNIWVAPPWPKCCPWQGGARQARLLTWPLWFWAALRTQQEPLSYTASPERLKCCRQAVTKSLI